MIQCSKCHYENPDGNRFCQQCGAPLVATAGGGEAVVSELSSPLPPPVQPQLSGLALPGDWSGPGDLAPVEDLGGNLVPGMELGVDSDLSLKADLEGERGSPLGWYSGENGSGLGEADGDPSLGHEGAEGGDGGGNGGQPGVDGMVAGELPEMARTLEEPVLGAWAEGWGREAFPVLQCEDASGAEVDGEGWSDEDETEFLLPREGEAESGLGEAEDSPTVLLPMQLMLVEAVGATHVGRQRARNEDFFDLQTYTSCVENPQGRSLQARGLYILCDGMGGHQGGEVASAMAVEQLKSFFRVHWQDELPDEDTISEAILVANQAIYEVNEQNDSLGSERMGTTLVLMLLQDNQVAVGHVGDSRLYRYTRRHGLEQITVDHEVGQLEVRRGVEPEIAYAHPGAYQLTQALGPKGRDFIRPEIQFFDLQEDTVLLLCSDGLSDYGLLDENLSAVETLMSSRVILEQGVSQLLELANSCNGHDNITAIAVRTRVRPNLNALERKP